MTPAYNAPHPAGCKAEDNKISSYENRVADRLFRNLVKMRNGGLGVFVSMIKCDDAMIQDRTNGTLRIILLYGILCLQVVCLEVVKLKKSGGRQYARVVRLEERL